MRPEIVAEAREWLGTPFVWQASLKGVGADCKGLVWGVARELGLPEANSLHAQIADYPDRVPVALLRQGLEATLTKVETPEPGDLLLMTFGGKPQHLGFHAGDQVIHTYGKGPRCVIAQPLSIVSRHFPIHSAWRFA